MLALRQVTDWDQAGAVVWEETAGQEGSPERLMETTSQSRATAALHILLPRKPFPPQTTSFFLAAVVAMEPLSFMCKCLSSSPMPISCRFTLQVYTGIAATDSRFGNM